MRRCGPIFYQWWGGLWTTGFAFALALRGSYWCVEFRRDPRFRR